MERKFTICPDAPQPAAADTSGEHSQDAKLRAFARANQQAARFEKLHPKLG